MVNSFRSIKTYFSRYFHRHGDDSPESSSGFPESPPESSPESLRQSAADSEFAPSTYDPKIRKRDKVRAFFRYYTGRIKVEEEVIELPEMLTLDPFAPHNKQFIEQIETPQKDSKTILLDSLAPVLSIQPESPKFGNLDISDFDNKENFNRENFNRENFNMDNFNKDNFNKENFNKDNFNKDNFEYRYDHSYDIVEPPELFPKEKHAKWERSQMLRHTASKTSLRRKSVIFQDPIDDSQLSVDLNSPIMGNVSQFFKSVSSLFNSPTKSEITTDINNEVVLAKFPESPMSARKAFESHTKESTIDMAKLRAESVDILQQIKQGQSETYKSLFHPTDDIPTLTQSLDPNDSQLSQSFVF
ncbi:hypothetical protein CLIB1444_22S00650 [[Candida] jaroonii]|uniref:Uncharacterized protein n=1 Tax=[Candida] jaroonii TaxID=467808 RepID=A0ACA9YGK1_9ASCO|nr:hypothetical protein CLIB1444_22S00650 [[Candida] jaroonii]